MPAVRTLKRTNVKGTVVELTRSESLNRNQKWDYEVIAGRERIGPILATKEQADKVFQKVVKNLKQTGSPRTRSFDETRGARSAGIGGGGFVTGHRPLEDERVGGGAGDESLDLDDVLYADDDRLPLFDEITDLRGSHNSNDREDDLY